MAKGYNLGEFEYLVLLALLRLGDRAYGMTVRRELFDTAGRDAGIGSVYQTLERLERKGLISSEVAPADPAVGGKPRRYFKVESIGREITFATRDSFAKMWDGLDSATESH